MKSVYQEVAKSRKYICGNWHFDFSLVFFYSFIETAKENPKYYLIS